MNTNQLLALLCELLLKSAFILISASLIQRAWTRASAAQRHLVWCAALTAILLLPLTRLVAPRWEVPIVRVSTLLPERVNLPRPTVVETAPVTQIAAEPIKAPRLQLPDWRVVVASIWAVGAAALLAARLFGSGRLLWLRISSPRIEDSRLSALADAVFREVGVRRRVALRLSPSGCVPLTWGTLRPVLMLPAEALRWSDARIVAALRHEAGHIVRGDHFTRWLAHLACALYWPNPLVWLAARRLRTEQEQATDDLVLRAGTPADEYAAQLFEVARTLAARRGLAQCAVAMASPSTLEQRMLAIVDEQRDRRPLSFRAVATGVLTVALTLGLATAAQLQAQEKAAPSTTEKSGDPQKPQVVIEARFVEINSAEERSDGGGQWLNHILTDGKGERIEGTKQVLPSAVANLPMLQGVLAPEQYSTVLRALSQKKGVDLMATPRITTLSGQRAVIEIARDFSYPTDWEKSGKTPKSDLRTSVEVEKEGQKWTPKAFETRKVGVTLEALADAKADGTIDLQVTPKVTEFQGFIDLDGDQNPPPDPPDTITRRDKAGRILQNDRPGRRMQPVFSERKLTSSVSIFPGQTVVIGGPSEADGTTFSDAPDGSKKKLHRQLLVFVTVNLAKGAPAPVPAVSPKPEPQPGAAASAPAESVALARARKIIIPKLEFRDATLRECVAILQGKRSDDWPDERRVNIVVNLPAGDEPKITLSLTNVPLIEAVHYVAELAGMKYVAEGNALVIVPKGQGEKPKPAESAPAKPKTEEAPKTEPAKSAALEKAQKIILPRVEFVEATAAEAVAFFRAKAVDLDVDKTGVNLVLEAGAAPDARLTLNLTNIPLSEALRYVAALAGLELVAEPNAIVLRGPKAEPAPSQAQATTGNKSMVVTSDQATFDRARNTAEFHGNVKIKQGDNVITGEKIKIQMLPETPANGAAVEGRAGVNVRQATPLDRVIPRRPDGN